MRGAATSALMEPRRTWRTLIYLVNFIFKSGPTSIYPPAADINGQAGLTSADVIYGVNYLFKSGPAPVCP